jgi:hypothetical protein
VVPNQKQQPHDQESYLHLDLFGRIHRLYVEEAGEGTPLLCLRTAGADGRQYRALMNDDRVTRRHRVIAFDMPWQASRRRRPDGTTMNTNSPRRNTPP